MKKLLFLVLLLLSFNASALGGFESLSGSEKKLLKLIVERLGIEDKDNSIKQKIYDKSSFAFDGNWSSYWVGLNELSLSNYKDGKEKGFIELGINNPDNGTIFLTYLYKPEVKQIILNSKQIRYGTKKMLLDVFEERKSDKEKYVVKHESGNYALLQEKGQVSFEYYHVGASADIGSLVYHGQVVIDI